MSQNQKLLKIAKSKVGISQNLKEKKRIQSFHWGQRDWEEEKDIEFIFNEKDLDLKPKARASHGLNRNPTVAGARSRDQPLAKNKKKSKANPTKREPETERKKKKRKNENPENELRPKVKDSCSVCQIAVQGLMFICPSCGHGGHFTHILEWFKTNSVCPKCWNCECFKKSN